MSTRPTRQSAVDARAKITDILPWETCPESSEAFQAAAARMETEFASAKHRRVTDAELAPSTAADDVDDSGSEVESSSDFDCDSDSDTSGSVPRSADLFSDSAASNDDDDLSGADPDGAVGDSFDSPV